jgi:hypothetical protein
LAQSTYHGSKRQGTDCTEGSATQEELSPPAFLGANLTCLQNSYIGINGRRKKFVTVDAAYNEIVPINALLRITR